VNGERVTSLMIHRDVLVLYVFSSCVKLLEIESTMLVMVPKLMHTMVAYAVIGVRDNSTTVVAMPVS